MFLLPNQSSPFFQTKENKRCWNRNKPFCRVKNDFSQTCFCLCALCVNHCFHCVQFVLYTSGWGRPLVCTIQSSPSLPPPLQKTKKEFLKKFTDLYRGGVCYVRSRSVGNLNRAAHMYFENDFISIPQSL